MKFASADIAACAVCSSSGSDSIRMSVTTTSAPWRARVRQSWRPRPREPPVTRATFPVRSQKAMSFLQRSRLVGLVGSARRSAQRDYRLAVVEHALAALVLHPDVQRGGARPLVERADRSPAGP